MHLPTSIKIGLQAYSFLWTIFMPFLYLNKRMRQGFEVRSLKRFPEGEFDLWIQAVSVGEAILAMEIIKNFPKTASIKILVTTNTSQGLEVLQIFCSELFSEEGCLGLEIAFFPFDKPSIMMRALARIKPKLVVLLESELWPGLLAGCKIKGIKTIVLNGRMTSKSLSRYLWWKSLWETLGPEKIYAMSDDNAKRFRTLFGTNKVQTMPNIKFDRVSDISRRKEKEPIKTLLPTAATFLVLASIRRQEEEECCTLISKIMKSKPNIVIGLFPRHMHRVDKWKKLLDSMSIQWVLRSQLTKLVPQGRVILWDTIGELSSAYEYASSVFVGGSLAPLGGHNFLEPMVCGCIPVIGKHWTDFSWVGREVLQKGLAVEVDNWHQLYDALEKQLESQLSRETVKSLALEYVHQKQGGGAIAYQEIRRLLFS